MTPLLPQQEIMVRFLDDHHEAALFCGMGLGKTRAILEAFQLLQADCAVRAMLVVAPLRVAILSWPAEIEKWAPHLRFANLRVQAGRDAWKRRSADIFLVNYEMLQSLEDAKLFAKDDLPADFLVIDESSKLKDPGSKRGKVLRRHRAKFRRAVVMTGTPAPNSLQDLWGQFRLLDNGKRLGSHFGAWRDRYWESDYLGYTFTIREGAKEKIEASIADVTLSLRSTDWLDVPPTTIVDIDVPFPPEARKLYQKMEKELLVEVGKSEVVALSAATLVTKLRQIASGAVITTNEVTGERIVAHVHGHKVEALKDLHLKNEKRPLLVVTNFIHERERILESIPWAQEFNETRLDDWNAGRIPIWVCHVASISHGLQMQGACCEICWFSLTYSQEDYSQTNARVIRTGQDKPTTVYRIITLDSIDAAMADVIRSKGENEQSLLTALVRNIRRLAENRITS